MSTTSSTSSSTSGISTMSGLRMSGTGLMSGLDTESLVKQMASATKNKINKQQQKLDLLSWKQTSYRSVIDKINTFKNNYLNSLKPDTNVGSNYLMASYTATSSNSKVIATASSNSSATSYKITDIQQLAENAEIKSDFSDGSSLSNGIKLDFSNAASGKTYNLKLNVDGLSKNITFTAGDNATDTAANFNKAIADTFKGTDIADDLKVDSSNNLKYTNKSTDNVTHSFILDISDLDNSTDKQVASLAAVGLTDGVSSKVTASSKLSSINFPTKLAGGSYSFKINGQEFTFDKDDAVKDIISEVNSNTKANVTLSFDSLAQKFSIKSNDSGAASSISLEQTSGNLLTSLFGSKVVAAGNNLSSISMKAKEITGTSITGKTDFTANGNSQINVTVNGVTKAIGLYTYDTNGTKYNYADVVDSKGAVTSAGAKQAAASLNEQLTREFGTDAPSFSYDEKTGKVSLTGDTFGDTVSVSAISGDSKSTALLAKLGYTANQTNEVKSSAKLSDLLGSNFKAGTITVGSTNVDITADTTVSDLGTKSGGLLSVDLTKGIISASKQITAADDNSKALVKALFNNSYDEVSAYSGTLTGAPSSTAASVTGKNAIMTINGTTITNASNSITLDGTSINIGNLTKADAEAVNDSDKAITISASRDTSKAFDAVVKFVNDYNNLITDLNAQIDTKRPTSDGTSTGTKYDPLTEEQKAEMSDKQIESWEAKAQTGLLYNDSTVSEFLTKIRSAVSTRTSDNFSLYDMGITVSGTYSDNGKLIIDESKLKAAFQANPDKIQELFTDSTNGLAANVSKAMDAAVSTKRGAYGSLTQLAGVTNTASASESSITKQINTYSADIKTLKTKYQDEIERYWAKFTNLETTMAKYNNQASVFSSSTSSSS